MVRGLQLLCSPRNFRERFVAHFGCRVGPGSASEPNCVHSLLHARAVLDSSGNPFVGLAGRDVNFAVAEQVIVPNGTVTFLAGEASPTTSIVVSFAEPVKLAGGNVSFRVALWGRDRGSVWQEHSDPERFADQATTAVPTRGLDKSRAYMKGNLGFILATNCSLEMFERCWQTTVFGKEQEPDKSPMSIWGCLQDRLVWIHRRSVSSGCLVL